jgi:malate dehydrogenase (oxaloacetate-decarboxylating)
MMVDSQGILNRNRRDLRTPGNAMKWWVCERSNHTQRSGGIAEALRGTDVCIALSRPGPGVIQPEWISTMAKDPIVFACANPVPEIWPWEAQAAGARVVATGRSDFPNQVNNSLGFPGIFRGVLDVRARTITDEMCITAAETLARYAAEKGLAEDYLLPRMDEWEVFAREATAVGMKAIEQGVAGLLLSEHELFAQAEATITHARAEMRALMEAGLIAAVKV